MEAHQQSKTKMSVEATCKSMKKTDDSVRLSTVLLFHAQVESGS
jgi:hypothetical protein